MCASPATPGAPGSPNKAGFNPAKPMVLVAPNAVAAWFAPKDADAWSCLTTSFSSSEVFSASSPVPPPPLLRPCFRSRARCRRFPRFRNRSSREGEDDDEDDEDDDDASEDEDEDEDVLLLDELAYLLLRLCRRPPPRWCLMGASKRGEGRRRWWYVTRSGQCGGWGLVSHHLLRFLPRRSSSRSRSLLLRGCFVTSGRCRRSSLSRRLSRRSRSRERERLRLQSGHHDFVMESRECIASHGEQDITASRYLSSPLSCASPWVLVSSSSRARLRSPMLR